MADPVGQRAQCAFCKILAGTAPAHTIRDWDDTIAIYPRADDHGRRGCTDGHILVIPREHVRDFTENPTVSATTAYRAAQLAAELGGQWNEITSAGVDATQTVFHLHRHLVPRRPGDGLMLPWSSRD